MYLSENGTAMFCLRHQKNQTYYMQVDIFYYANENTIYLIIA